MQTLPTYLEQMDDNLGFAVVPFIKFRVSSRTSTRETRRVEVHIDTCIRTRITEKMAQVPGCLVLQIGKYLY